MSKIIEWRIAEIKRFIWKYECPCCKEIMDVPKEDIEHYQTCPACGTKDNKWKRKRKIVKYYFIQCSKCGAMIQINENEVLKWNYCPKCSKPQIIEVKV